MWLGGRWWLARWLTSDNISLSVAFTPFGSLFLLSPVFLGALTAFDYFVHLTDDVLSVRQEDSIFVDWRVPRRHHWSIDVGNIWERDETFAVGSVNLFHWPVPLKRRLASFGTSDNLGWLVGVRVHVRPGIAHKRCRSRFISIYKSGRFGDIPREVCREQIKGNHE